VDVKAKLDATLAAIDTSDLNAFCYVDRERARAAAADADVSLPFGGVPTAIKQLEAVDGWPWTEASLVYKDRVATHTSHNVQRLFERGDGHLDHRRVGLARGDPLQDEPGRDEQADDRVPLVGRAEAE
jgi:hypothetical protein